MSTVYGIGGYLPAKPNGNKVEESDLVAGTFTRWDADGNVLEARPLTTDEIAALTPPPVVKSDAEKLEAAAAALAELENIAAPVLATDVLDVLADLRTALEA